MAEHSPHRLNVKGSRPHRWHRERETSKKNFQRASLFYSERGRQRFKESPLAAQVICQIWAAIHKTFYKFLTSFL